MPLVKAGQIVEDQYVHVEDDAPMPDGVPVHRCRRRAFSPMCATSSSAMLRSA